MGARRTLLFNRVMLAAQSEPSEADSTVVQYESECIDPIVGKILAGWRYDISGLAPEMRGDYEEHFAALRTLPPQAATAPQYRR